MSSATGLLRGIGRSVLRVRSGAATRHYATGRAPVRSSWGRNRNAILTATAVSVPALYLLFRRPVSTSRRPVDAGSEASALPPRPDPAERARAAKESGNGKAPRASHPEHREPEKYKPPFGQVHQAKRVDSPPDGRNHADLAARNKNL